MGWEASWSIGVEEGEVGFHDGVVKHIPPLCCSRVGGLGVPSWMMGVEITQDDGVTLGLRDEME